MWHTVPLPAHFHTGYAVVLGFLTAAIVLRAIYRPRAHLLFRFWVVSGALLSFAAELYPFDTAYAGATSVLVGAAICTLALFGEVVVSMQREDFEAARPRERAGD